MKAIDLVPGQTYAFVVGRGPRHNPHRLGQKYNVHPCIVLDNEFHHWGNGCTQVHWNGIDRRRNTHVPIARPGAGSATKAGPVWDLDLIQPSYILGTWDEHLEAMGNRTARSERLRKEQLIQDEKDRRWRVKVSRRMYQLGIDPLTYEINASRRTLTLHHDAVLEVLGPEPKAKAS